MVSCPWPAMLQVLVVGVAVVLAGAAVWVYIAVNSTTAVSKEIPGCAIAEKDKSSMVLTIPFKDAFFMCEPDKPVSDPIKWRTICDAKVNIRGLFRDTTTGDNASARVRITNMIPPGQKMIWEFGHIERSDDGQDVTLTLACGTRWRGGFAIHQEIG